MPESIIFEVSFHALRGKWKSFFLKSLKDSTGADSTKVATIAVAAVESVFEKNQEYVDVMNKFPDWTFAMQQQADVSSYAIKENGF